VITAVVEGGVLVGVHPDSVATADVDPSPTVALHVLDL
jgi:hypothetical protein